MGEEKKRAAESPFLHMTQQQAQAISVPDIMKRAEEQFTRYEERLANQYAAITRLLEHHHAVHSSCAFEDLDEKE